MNRIDVIVIQDCVIGGTLYFGSSGERLSLSAHWAQHHLDAGHVRLANACPECGGTTEVMPATTLEEYHPGELVAGRPFPTREKTTIVLACSGCEYCVEVT